MRAPGPLLLAAVLALAACARAGGTVAPEAGTAASPQAPAAPAETARMQPSGATPSTASPAAAPAPRLTFAELLGSEASRLDSLLGTPDLVRRDGSGEVRVYRNPECVIHVFVYPRDGAPRATHIEARNGVSRLAPAETEACIARFG